MYVYGFFCFFLGGGERSGACVKYRPSKDKLNAVNRSRECEVEELKVIKRNNPEIRQGESKLTTSPCTPQGTNEYRPENTSSPMDCDVAKHCLVKKSICVNRLPMH
jgi:hypothetical protein